MYAIRSYYGVTLPVDAGGERGRVDVWAPEARAEAAVVDDLAACQAAGDSVLRNNFV